MKKILLTLGIIFLSSSTFANESMLTNCNKKHSKTVENVVNVKMSPSKKSAAE